MSSEEITALRQNRLALSAAVSAAAVAWTPGATELVVATSATPIEPVPPTLRIVATTSRAGA